MSIWRHFNSFLIKLDRKPEDWEQRTALFCAYLIDKGNKSTTLKSYVSAIKMILREDGYQWEDNKILLSSLTRACKLENDTVKCRFPIQRKLLELILFENQRLHSNQLYLQVLYEAILLLAYYGLMRIGELTQGDHPIKARDVHIATNKDKMLIVLHSSKTHGKESLPQKIRIVANDQRKKSNYLVNCFFCPFIAVRNYIAIRGNYVSDTENFFVFSDKSPVTPVHVRCILRQCLDILGLDSNLYDTHSARAGRALDMLKMNFSIQEIQAAGRWRSNAVYKYLKE